MLDPSEQTLPIDILYELIYRLDDSNRSLLLSLGLLCKDILLITRRRLFSSIVFTKNKDFDRFLYLTNAPWTSFTPAVEEIHLQDLFHPEYDYRNRSDPKTVALNLCNVKSFSIFLHSVWKLGWVFIPRSIFDVISQLKIRDLQLDGVGMTNAEDIVMLFTHLPSTVETLAFRRLRFHEIKDTDLSRHLSVFRRPLRFRFLDNLSLAFFKGVLDPWINSGLDVIVQGFHIRDPVLPAAEDYNPLTRRFLQHVGHNLEQLFITFHKPYTFATFEESIKYLEPIQVTQCINLRMLSIAFPTFAYAKQDPIPLLVSAMWKILPALPEPNSLETFWFKFTLYDGPTPVRKQLTSLGFFESPNCIDKIWCMFPNLKLIKIVLGVYKLEETDMYFRMLRKIEGLRKLEVKGIIKLVAVDLEKHDACHSILEGCRL